MARPNKRRFGSAIQASIPHPHGIGLGTRRCRLANKQMFAVGLLPWPTECATNHIIGPEVSAGIRASARCQIAREQSRMGKDWTSWAAADSSPSTARRFWAPNLGGAPFLPGR
jgi:hypothetical protein